MSEVIELEKPDEVKAVVGKDFTYLHLLTFAEVLRSKIPVINMQGEMFGGLDRKIWKVAQANEVFLAWQKAIQAAAQTPGTVPSEVMNNFQETKMLSHAPDEVIKAPGIGATLAETNPHCANKDAVMANVLTSSAVEGINVTKEQVLDYATKHPKPPKFSWSFTGIDVFHKCCPRKFAARWFYKTEKFEETDASIWGNRVHKAQEQFLKDLVVDEPELVTKYAKYFKSGAGYEILTEQEIALNRKWGITEWFAQDAWGRAKIDVALLQGDMIKIYDWKTGKEKFDALQLRVFCLFAALKYPLVQKFEARFIWLKDDKVSEAVILTRAEVVGVLKEVMGLVERMEAAWNSEIFQCRPNGLCKNYCSVEDCPHHGGKR